ncbi:hypothetical protein [Vibrio maerlii]|uniref:hypothetical protein n=1 Tax=Vibrio maerlii TaxID=2231648 RepID=UPI0013E021FA|nr:hypothetical protein [Vibrio maerlii]
MKSDYEVLLIAKSKQLKVSVDEIKLALAIKSLRRGNELTEDDVILLRELDSNDLL